MPAIKKNDFVKTKACPECGCDMVHTHPAKTVRGQVRYYRRWSCTECEFYESTGYKPTKSDLIPEAKPGFKLSLVELEELKNKRADHFFPKDHKLLKHQGKKFTN